jgi:hypothetical protein
VDRDEEGPIVATFRCATCSGTTTVVLLPPHARDPRFAPGGRYPPRVDRIGEEGWRLSIDGPMSVTISPIREHEAVADALRKSDPKALAAIDSEYASFWCWRCGTCYCKDHLKGVPVFDDGFYDATYATCPAGHRVKLDD